MTAAPPVADAGLSAAGDPSTAPTRTEWIWFVALPFAVAVLLSFAHTPDDAFITLRYAWNLVHGHGPVFNPGEHVVGASSALHLVLSAAVALVPHSWALVVAKFVSLGFGALALWQAVLLVSVVGLPTWARRVGYLALAASSLLALSAANGLETTLYTFLVTLLVRWLVLGRGITAPLATGAVAGLVVVTRPDGALVVAALVAAALFLERGRPRVQAIRWALGAVVGLAVLLGGTFVFTGDPLPNTYYAKRIPLTRALPDGWQYLQHALSPAMTRTGLTGVVGALLFAGMFALLTVGVVVLVRRRTRVAYTVALLGAQVAFLLESGGDWMRGGRFLVPALGALVVVAMSGVVTTADAVARRFPELRLVATVIGVVVVLGATLVPWTTVSVPVWRVGGAYDADAFVAAGGYGQYATAWTAVPHVMACFPGARVATSEVGNAGWSALDRPILDLRGLTDDVIAHDAPAGQRTSAGIALGEWSRPGSVIGRRIRAWHADLVVLLGDEARMPTSALGGHLVRRAMVPLATGGRLAVYSRPGMVDSCTERDLPG
jgi:arabinofuranosyltransferase